MDVGIGSAACVALSFPIMEKLYSIWYQSGCFSLMDVGIGSAACVALFFFPFQPYPGNFHTCSYASAICTVAGPQSWGALQSATGNVS